MKIRKILKCSAAFFMLALLLAGMVVGTSAAVNSYQIRFLPNGADGKMYSQTASVNSIVSLRGVAFERPGYSFCGWALSSSGNEVYRDRAKVMNLGKSGKTVNLFAVWEAGSFTAAFASNGGSGRMTNVRFVYDTAKSIPTCTFRRSGYTFVGWNLSVNVDSAKAVGYSADGSASGMVRFFVEGSQPDGWQPVICYDGQSISQVAAPSGSTVTFSAVWRKNTSQNCTVTFDSADGAGEMQPLTVPKGSSVTLPANVFTREKYLFAGWALTEDGEAVYCDGDTVDVNGNLTLYAVWDSADYILLFTSNGDGTCNVSGVRECAEERIVIPSVSPDNETVTGISARAFSGCDYLTSISIPQTVTSIGLRAFNGCSGLTEMTIPSSVTKIGSQIFYNCTNLETVIYNSDYSPATNTVFLNISGLSSVVFGGQSVPANICYNCNNITEVTIGGEVRSIGNSAFSGCSSITGITLPSGLEQIGDRAFYGCSSLEGISIPDSVTAIGNSVFYNCSDLCVVTLPSHITSVGAYSFYNCTSLLNMTVPAEVESIGSYAFRYCTRLESVYLPASLRSIGAWAFGNCTGLTGIVLPSGIAEIGDYAFNECSGLVSITLPSSVTVLGNYLFNSCTLLSEVFLPDGLTTIGNYTFCGCTKLEEIGIPENVTAIGEGAFSGCTKLSSVELPDSLLTLGGLAFYRCTALSEIQIPSGVSNIGNGVFRECTALTSITVSNDNSAFCSVGNCLIRIEDNAVIAGCRTSVIPDDGSVCSIADYAFEGCVGLSKITLPASVTKVGDYAFDGCTGLTEISVSGSIGKYAFRGCTSLVKIKFAGTADEWAALPKGYGWDSGSGTYTVYCSDRNVTK
ncbi:MAG: leucine-rich repeat protein [Clostridia bacterium]|nr:leucine-rich repeat protein [Clostridia bacterium]